jgi:hypothetical protein
VAVDERWPEEEEEEEAALLYRDGVEGAESSK